MRHRSLRVPIVLDRACLGVQCGEGETCERGVCVSAAVQTCIGGDCELDVDGAAPLPPLTDGATLDVVAPPTDPPDASGLDAGDQKIDASLCPARPPIAACVECEKKGKECCITNSGITCVDLGSCPDFGVPTSRGCSEPCHCFPGETCSIGSCPVRVCGGSCFPQR